MFNGMITSNTGNHLTWLTSLTELLEIELLEHLTVCKQKNDV